MVIIDDVIYAVCYNRWAVTWLEKSEDFGRSWEVVSWLDERLWTNQIECGRINEASLGYYDGKMYVVGRQQSENGDNRLEIGVSEDLGVTWTWSFLPIEGHAPSLTPYKDAFILTYRNVKDSVVNIVLIRYFLKMGSWLVILLVFLKAIILMSATEMFLLYQIVSWFAVINRALSVVMN